MIDLDVLEKQPLIDIVPHPDVRTGLSSSPIVAIPATTLDALVRAVRAALEADEFVPDDTATAREVGDRLSAALAPFRPAS